MPQTFTRQDLPTNTSERPSAPEWREAVSTVRHFSTEPDFLQRLNEQGLDPTDRTSVGYADALSLYAQDYTDVYQKDGTVDHATAAKIRVIANTPYFIHVEKELKYFETERAKHRNFSDEEWRYYQGFKPYAVWYNQQLSDVIYANPESKMSDLNRALIEQSLVSFPRQASLVETDVKQATRGQRTEAVARQLCDLAGIKYAPGTPEDDLRGGDLIVLHNGKRIKVDIKSSLSAIAAIRGSYEDIEKRHITYAIEKNRRDTSNAQHVIVLFPGFTDSDLGDRMSLNLPQSQLIERADFLAKQLKLAFAEMHV